MARTLVNTRKIEVILRYAKKNKSAHGLPRQYTNFHILTIYISCVSGISYMNLLPIYYF